ncbi:hypothetical protein NKI48_25790 [Mesorhizobium sp. M0644]|uniref:hypothetical protein n=1 Tax=unclassified Mesorhizobium TaxID=325217 RepID=UPI0033353F5F
MVNPAVGYRPKISGTVIHPSASLGEMTRMLDADGNMVGFVMLPGFPDVASLDKHLAGKRYQRDGLSGEIEMGFVDSGTSCQQHRVRAADGPHL